MDIAAEFITSIHKRIKNRYGEQIAQYLFFAPNIFFTYLTYENKQKKLFAMQILNYLELDETRNQRLHPRPCLYYGSILRIFVYFKCFDSRSVEANGFEDFWTGTNRYFPLYPFEFGICFLSLKV